MLMLLLVILMMMMMMFRSVDAVNETLPCKVKSNIVFCAKLQFKNQVVGVSMDTTTSIFDWLDSNPDLKEFNVPLMSDRWTLRAVTNFLSFTMLLTRDAEISRAFGVIQRGFSAGQVCSWLVGLLRANDML